jgi:hypothetical protein
MMMIPNSVSRAACLRKYALFALFLIGLMLSIFLLAAPAFAQDTGEETLTFDGLIEARAVGSDLDMDQGDGIDSSGFGARVRLGINYSLTENTSVRAEGEARVFEFRDEERASLETKIARLQIDHEVSDEVQVRGYARRLENIALLEAFQADQTSVGARVQWQKGKTRLRVTGEYRERDYDTAVRGNSDGYRAAAEVNRRLGSYHWVRLNVSADANDSADEPRRSYDRQIARVTYSKPIAERLRIRPSIEYRQWDYDSRIARGAADGELRKDSYIAPGIALAWSQPSSGLYASANAEYRFKQSNDERFQNDALRVGVRVGWRF